MADDVSIIKVTVPAEVSVVKVIVPDPVAMVKVLVPGMPGPKGDQGEPGLSAGDATTAALEEHIHNTLPHPVYDDLPSLRLIFENGLV